MPSPPTLMYRDYFIKSYRLTTTIKDHIKRTYNEITDRNVEKTLTIWSKDFIKSHHSSLDIKDYYYFKYDKLPTYAFLLVLTQTQTNHPYLCYTNLKSNRVQFIIPFGEGQGQIPLHYLDSSINKKELNREELNVFYIYIQKNIVNRKNAILNVKQFSLLNCSNISNCHKKINEIRKMRVSSAKKKELEEHYTLYYQKKAIEFISKYFALLEREYFDEAFLFLRGSKGKYFGKQRLNTFFKNSKQIVGHLQIFINLYQMLHTLYKKKAI